MPDYYIAPKGSFDATADAVRALNGTQADLEWGQDGFATQIGNERRWTVQDMATGAAPSGVITLSGTTIKSYVFYQKTALTGVTAANYAGHTTDGHQFEGCTSLTSVSFPALVTGCPSMFYGCTGLTAINDTMFPVLADSYDNIFNGCTYVTAVTLSNLTGALNKNNKFRGMSRLQIADLPKYQNVAQYDFYADPQLTTVKLGKTSTATTRTIQAYAFMSCSALDTLVLYGDVLWTLSNVNAFNQTPFRSGGTGGTIYISKTLYDHLGDGTAYDYKAATNWSTIDGYSTITWAKIEGSIYDT